MSLVALVDRAPSQAATAGDSGMSPERGVASQGVLGQGAVARHRGDVLQVGQGRRPRPLERCHDGEPERVTRPGVPTLLGQDRNGIHGTGGGNDDIACERYQGGYVGGRPDQ